MRICFEAAVMMGDVRAELEAMSREFPASAGERLEAPA